MFSIFTLLWKRSLQLFHLEKPKLNILYKTTPLPPSFEPPVTIFVFSISLNFITFNTSYGRIVQYLSLFNWLISIKIIFSNFIYIVACDKIFFPFFGWIIFQCMHTSHSVYPFLLMNTSDASIFWLSNNI